MSRGLVRELVRLGWPVLIAQLVVMANGVIDTIMAGRYGTQAVVVNVLRGYKRAVVPMLIYAVALWGVGLGGGYAIGLTSIDLAWLGLSTPLGAPGFWLAAIASLVLASSLVTAYFLRVSGAATTSAASNSRR